MSSRRVVVEMSTTGLGENGNGIELNHDLSEPAVSVGTRSQKQLVSSADVSDDDIEEKEDDVPKPVSIFKLFRYATLLDLFLIFVSLLMAVAHGVAIPLATIVFGETVGLFSSLVISDRVFVEISTNNISTPLQSFSFVEGDQHLTTLTAIQQMIIDEVVVDTEDKLFEFLVTLATTTSTSNISTNEIANISCLVYQYSNDLNMTTFQTLNDIVNNNFTIPSSSERCNCVLAFFDVFGDVRCLPTNEFLFGVTPGDGILWHIYYSFILATGVLIASFFQISLIQIASERQVCKIRVLFYRSVLRQDIGWFDTTAGGELASRLTSDIDKIHRGIGQNFAILVQWISSFVAGIIVGFASSWQLSLLLLLLIPFMAGSVLISSWINSWFTTKEQNAYAQAGSVAEEVLPAVKTVAAFGGEEKEIDRYKRHLAMASSMGIKKGLLVGVSYFFVYFLIFTSFAAVLWFGSYLYDENLLELRQMLTVFFSMLIAAFAIGVAAGDLESVAAALGSASVVYSTIDRVPPIDSSSTEGLVPDTLVPTIEFKDVCFSYPANPRVQVLRGVNMKANVGQTVALVGPSGSGKSTVVQLLQRFYDVTGGQVLVGGNDIRTLNLQWLRNNVGVVSQEPVLFDTTIAENIRFGRQDATIEDIKRAAKQANAHNFIIQLPDGYHTHVGERGAQMSGGQKQRIAIARALVRDPKILLLDEATSALDTESERVVQEALDKARKGRTTIVIAHRLSTIRAADVIASMEAGRVVEMGTHTDLMNNSGLYYELVTAQSHGDADKEFTLNNPLRQNSTKSMKSIHHRLSRRASHRQPDRQPSAQSILQSPRFLRQFSRQFSRRFIGESVASAGGDEDGGEGSLRCVTHRTVSRGYSRHDIVIEEEVTYDRMEDQQTRWDSEIPSVSLKRILSYIRMDWCIVLVGIAGAVVVGMSFPLFAITFGESLGVIFDNTDGTIFDEMHPTAAGMLAIGVALGTANFLKSVGFSVFGQQLTTRLRVDSFKSILRQEIGWFDLEKNSTGVLTLRLSQDASHVQGIIGNKLIETVVGLVCFVFSSFAFSWLTSFAVLSVVPLMVLSAVLRLAAYNSSVSVTKHALEQNNKIAVDSIDNIRTFATLSLESKFLKDYQDKLRSPYRRSLLLAPLHGFSYGFTFAVLYLGYAVTFGFGGAFQFVQDSTSILYTDLVNLFVVFIAMVFGALVAGQASIFLPQYNRAKLSAKRIFSLIDKQSQVDATSEDGEVLEKMVANIDLNAVTFAYPTRPNALVLRGLNISVNPGQTLALVGTSGSGKSTIISLIERFYNPASGVITLDGTQLQDVNLRWLRSQIGLVSQEPVLFDASIADNIRYGANFRKVSDEEIVEAAKAANIHSFIETLPQGYATDVGAKGAQMSGGQKQRIAIARALVRDPKILLLDEATSALDTESERVIQEALDKARKGRTTIVIAHRLSTIYTADMIAVLHKGEVVELGNHEQLMRKRGIYYRLNSLQLRDDATASQPLDPHSIDCECSLKSFSKLQTMCEEEEENPEDNSSAIG